MATLPDDLDLRTVLTWLRGVGEPRTTNALDVPGATPDELSRLAALGSLVRLVVERVGAREELAVLNAVEGVASWLESTVEVPEQVVSAAERLAGDSEALAALYASSVAAANRRELGTFFTLLRKWFVRSKRALRRASCRRLSLTSARESGSSR